MSEGSHSCNFIGPFRSDLHKVVSGGGPRKETLFPPRSIGYAATYVACSGCPPCDASLALVAPAAPIAPSTPTATSTNIAKSRVRMRVSSPTRPRSVSTCPVAAEFNRRRCPPRMSDLYPPRVPRWCRDAQGGRWQLSTGGALGCCDSRGCHQPPHSRERLEAHSSYGLCRLSHKDAAGRANDPAPKSRPAPGTGNVRPTFTTATGSGWRSSAFAT